MFNLILFGPPGSGKGTQSEKIIEKYSFKHLSTGDLLRSEIAQQTVLGTAAIKIMSAGHLVPDSVVVGMISTCLDNNPRVTGFIYDGFPRTAAQAEALDRLLKDKNEAINVLIALDVSEAEITSRLLKRGVTGGRADDTDAEVIAKRIKVYRNETEQVADYYRKYNKTVMVPGEGTIDEIFQRICTEIDSRL
ncbi:MAG: adenylate kinase [Ferruginibacter sp.]